MFVAECWINDNNIKYKVWEALLSMIFWVSWMFQDKLRPDLERNKTWVKLRTHNQSISQSVNQSITWWLECSCRISQGPMSLTEVSTWMFGPRRVVWRSHVFLNHVISDGLKVNQPSRLWIFLQNVLIQSAKTRLDHTWCFNFSPSRLIYSTPLVYTSVPSRKENDAPTARPSTRKKVMREPAVSQSLCLTSLRTETGSYNASTRASKDAEQLPTETSETTKCQTSETQRRTQDPISLQIT